MDGEESWFRPIFWVYNPKGQTKYVWFLIRQQPFKDIP